MQSLQMRWPVAGHHRIVDGDDGEARRARMPCALAACASRRSSRRAGSRRGSRRTALFWNAPVLRSFRPVRAAVLALVVAPDAVVGLVERAGQIPCRDRSARSRRAGANLSRQAQHGDAVLPRSSRPARDAYGSSLVRHVEQHAVAVLRACPPASASPRRRSARPGRAPPAWSPRRPSSARHARAKTVLGQRVRRTASSRSRASARPSSAAACSGVTPLTARR